MTAPKHAGQAAPRAGLRAALSWAVFAVALGAGASAASPASAQATARVHVARPRPAVRPNRTEPTVDGVREALAALTPDVDRCAREHPLPSQPRRFPIGVRVRFHPHGRWHIETPMLEENGRIPSDRRALADCLHRAARRLLAPRMGPFSGGAPLKAERVFVVSEPAPALPAETLERLIRARFSRSLRACAVAAGATAEAQQAAQAAPLGVRATLTASGQVVLRGLEVPDAVDFDDAATCAAAVLAPIQIGPRAAATTFWVEIAP